MILNFVYNIIYGMKSRNKNRILFVKALDVFFRTPVLLFLMMIFVTKTFTVSKFIFGRKI